MARKTVYLIIFITCLSLINTSCNKEDDLWAEELDLLEQYISENNITTQPLASGLYYIETSDGLGPLPISGQTVVVHYTGRLIDGTKFDSSYDRGEPFVFQIGTGEVIEGWDEGISYMHSGGEATLIIPSNLGYGSSGAGSIPPYSTLIFEVKLIDVY